MFLRRLRSHIGGLIRLKTGLFWYDGSGYDNAPERVCLLLETFSAGVEGPRTVATTASARRPAAVTKGSAATTGSAAQASSAMPALLLVDGSPHWIWLVEDDVELFPFNPCGSEAGIL